MPQGVPNGGAAKGTHTKAALMSKATAKKAHHEQLAAAVKLVAEGQGLGTVVGMVEGCNLEQIKYAVKKATSKQPTRQSWAILTDMEMEKLVKWCIASAKNDNPAMESEVNDQVTKILQCRRLANRAKRRASNIELSTAETRIALQGGTLSHTWFQGFYAANPSCQLKTAHKQEAKRVGKQRKDVVERHFNGEFGLAASLKGQGPRHHGR